MKTTQLGIAGAITALVVASEARAGQVELIERPGHSTEATFTLDATPAQVYAVVTDYARWRNVFTDVISVTVKSGGRGDAVVRFRSRALEHEVTVQFDNQPDRRISFRGIKGPPGGRAHGSFTLTPVGDGTRTYVTANLYMDVVGLPGLLVSDATVRSMRRAKLTADVADMLRHFPARSS